ncbi:helix-turn-helix transcriptional regulator [Cellulosimicrobium cellulans]|uniref:helix-turn-helix transcriptional regulator n=1 Tax=Cellulosimicrobium cellulans TaxID=1710 RepID=UPI002405974D|nr:LuxR family transcriptional regulator [Cellulosimicrobium cellulans]MDF9877772.1 DNA-binding CsgD family transcriptional regulator [Cellulosimicrobium cellulans]
MHGGGRLLGRVDERQRLNALVSGARNGRGGATAVLGEPGIGKTTLVAATSEEAGLALLHVDGFESESSMPFAAIQRLVSLLQDRLEEIPARQRQAVLVASGQSDGPAPDRFLVGLGMLSLLAAASAGEPVVCAVDDAHLVDAESLDVLAFVARRLAAERVAMVFAGRAEPPLVERLAGVPQLVLAGLDPETAVRLLHRSALRPLAPPAALAIARATGGNPLALIDLAGESLVHELPDLGISDEPVPIGRHLEEHYVRRVRQAEASVQRWVLLAAADSTGNADLVSGAARELGLEPDGGDRAELAGLLSLAPSVRFRHPLVRSAVYNAASGTERRHVHRALARVADRLGLVETEAWHAARAVVGTDEAVADRLAHTADLAARRGGFASRASILARAAELTPPGPAREDRRAAAAEAALAAGATHVAQRLVEEADLSVAGPVTHGRVTLVRSALGLFVGDADGVRGATAACLEAAHHFHGRDVDREQRALLQAFEMSCTAEFAMVAVTPDELGRRLVAGAELAPGPSGTILRGLGALALEPYDQAVGPARDALDAILALPDDQMMRMHSAIASLGTFLWDDAGRADALVRAARAARDAGALQQLDSILWTTAISELCGGTLQRATRADDLVREVRRAMGFDAENVVNAAVLAWSGAPHEAVLAVAHGALETGFGGVTSSGIAALVVRDLADGSYRDAYERHLPLVTRPFLHVTPSQYGDFVEAAVRSGHAREAHSRVQELVVRADANGSAWCRGVAERALALVADDDDEPHYVASLDALASTRAEMDLARSHLVYGEWLRRARRRRDAARQLRLALGHFHDSGAELFVPRTLAELKVVGAEARVDGRTRHLDLTAQELSVARLAAAGRTNAEIGANLFISPNTVDYHLRKVFQKLGISSRRQLADRVADRGSP